MQKWNSRKTTLIDNKYDAHDAEDEIMQVLGELRLTIKDQRRRQHEQEEDNSDHQSARRITKYAKALRFIEALACKYKISSKQTWYWHAQLFELWQKSKSNPNGKAAGIG
jgi:hypothetical protein